jgi:beta-mannosidase
MVCQVPVKDILAGADPLDSYVRLIYTDSDGQEHSNLRFFTNQKNVRFLNPDINLNVKQVADYKEITLVSKTFARAVYLSVKDSELLHFSDNFFDLHPGEQYTVRVKTDMSAEELASRLQFNCINKFLY